MKHTGAVAAIQVTRGRVSAGRNKLNVFSMLAACLVFGLWQTGCIGVTGTNPSNPLTNTPALTVSPASLSFGTIALGSSSTQNVTLTNSGTATLTVSGDTASGTGFSIVGGSTSLTIAVGQTQTIQVKYAPLAMGTSSGSLTVTSNDPASPKTAALTGSGGQPQIAFTPNSIGFGNVSVGGSSSQTVTVSNNGNMALTISSISVGGAGYTMTGLSAPMTLNTGQSAPFIVKFAPAVTGSVSGSIGVTSNAPNPPQTIAFSGTGVASSSILSANPNSFAFGNVNVGASATQNISLSNTGTTSLTISQITTSGTGFSSSGITVPITLAVGQSATLAAKYSPASAVSGSGGITVTSNASNPTLTIALTGTGVQAQPLITANPASIAFGNVAVGGSASQTVTLNNTGNATLTISALTASGTGYSVSGFTLPISIAAGATSTFTAKFAPAAIGSVPGSASITSNAPGSPLTIAVTGTGVQPGLSANPASVAFGSVAVGGSSAQTITLNNTGTSNLTISALTASGTGYSVSGFTLPISIAAGASSPITATFAPTAAGSPAGSISITSNAPSSPTTIAMTGTGVQSGLSANPASVAFGNVTVGSSGSQTVTLNNTGTSTLTISALTASGTGYSVSGFTLPISIAVGASSTFTAKFTPAATGSVPGSVSITSNAPGSPLSIAMTGTGAQGQVTPTPASVSFGNVLVGASSSQTLTLKNNGTVSVTISQATASGTGFSISALALPLTLTTGQSTPLTATFTPASAASASGSITVTSNGSNPNLTIALTGTGTQPLITTTPSTVGFGNVTVGSPNSQTIRINNTGTATLTISQATATGTGFSISGLTVPANIAAGGNTTFNVTFAPTTAGVVGGSVALTNNSGTSPLSISLSGTGVASTLLLNASATSLSFGNVTVGSNASLSVTLTNSGNSSVTVSSVTVTGTGYISSGVVSAQVIAAGATATLSAKFTPLVAGLSSGNITVASNATNSPVTISVSGTGVIPVLHSVALSWTASTSTVAGYKVYRSALSGGPYTLLTSSLVVGTTYTDSTVLAGLTYFYVVTAVDANGSESVFSNEVSAVIPIP